MNENISDSYINICEAAKLIHKITDKNYIEIVRLFKSKLSRNLDVYYIDEVFLFEIMNKNEKQIALRETFQLISNKGLADSLGYEIPSNSIERMLSGDHPHWTNSFWNKIKFFQHHAILSLNLDAEENLSSDDSIPNINIDEIQIHMLGGERMKNRANENHQKIFSLYERFLNHPDQVQKRYKKNITGFSNYFIDHFDKHGIEKSDGKEYSDPKTIARIIGEKSKTSK